MASTSSSPRLPPGLERPPLIGQSDRVNSLNLPSSPSPISSQQQQGHDHLQQNSEDKSQGRVWGLQLLGGEQYLSKRQCRTSFQNDPIGSRPNSRADGNTYKPDLATETVGAPMISTEAATGVHAAASSAAARSRAVSPVQGESSAGQKSGGFSLMGMGTSYKANYPFCFDNSSSPSFFSAQSQSQDDHFAQISAQSSKRRIDAPKFVLDGIESSANMKNITEGKENHPIKMTIGASGIDSTAQKSMMRDHISPTGSAVSALADITKDQRLIGRDMAEIYPQQMMTGRSVSPQRFDGGRDVLSSPTPLLGLPQALTSSTGLLSPTAATHAGSGGFGNSRPFSPFEETPPRDTEGEFTTSYPVKQGHIQGTDIPDAIDTSLQGSQVVLGILDRLNQVESNFQLVQRNISNLDWNVTRLLRRMEDDNHQPLPSNAWNDNEDLRNMSAQIVQLTSTVSQLMVQQGVKNSSLQDHASSLAGLGLGSNTPQLSGHFNSVSTPQVGTFPESLQGYATTPSNSRNSNFLIGSNDSPRNSGNLFGGLNQQSNNARNDRNSRLSPRPGASPSPTSRRWSSMTPGTPEIVSSQNSNGAMNPPEANVVLTKWEHLNLHQDLLRCILKYGLGPPNKIQQRALPFLLRGSDIIAQAPPTQERIASYVIPVLQLVLNVLRGEALPSHLGVRGPIALIISTTVDQATQIQRMALGLGSSLGIRVHIAAASSLEIAQEAAGLIQMQPQIVVGTPQKMMDLFNFLANKTKGAISLEDIRLVVLDEVDQLIARNLADHVSTLLQILPQPRIVVNKSNTGVLRSPSLSPDLPPTLNNVFNPYEMSSSPLPASMATADRQTAIFSNTVPQDVLNFAQSIHLRESVRVLVRREVGQTNTGNSTGVTLVSPNASASSHIINSSTGTKQQAQQQTPSNTVGATPAYNNLNPLSDPLLASLRGLSQYYVYIAISTNGNGIAGMPSFHSNSSQFSHAIEMKLDVITDLLQDIEFGQAVIYTSSSITHEAMTYKLASKGIEALALHRDMASTTRQQVLAKYRNRSSSTKSVSLYHQAGIQVVGNRKPTLDGSKSSFSKKALVIYDVAIQPKDVHQVPLMIFYDLPKTVEEYKEKISCAANTNQDMLGRPSVCINVVTGSGGPRGDIEMLRTLECQLGCKMAELPMNPSQILNF